MDKYSLIPSKSNKDSIKYARAYFARHLKYEKFSSDAINLSSKLSSSIQPLINDGVQTIPNFWDKKLIEDINKKVQEAFKSIKYITVRDYSKEVASKGKKVNRNYIDLKYDNLSELKEKVSGVTLPDPLLNIPLIYKLIFDERFINLISAYYSAIPKLTFLKVRHAFASEDYSPKDTQLWHYDPGSFRLLKVVIYLDDVIDKSHGPFEYIKKTHNLDFSDPLYQNARIEDDFINKNFLSKINTVLAKKQDLNLTDATGIHRGLQPHKKDRTVLIANFCLHRESGFPFKRVKVMKNHFNNFSNLEKALFDDVNLV